MWDGTLLFIAATQQRVISIHPSRVGWDSTDSVIISCLHYFNPPIPCGMGHCGCRMTVDYWEFQSTHPVWDGTQFINVFLLDHKISIHPSRVGWDYKISYVDKLRIISIHPSRVGWDPFPPMLIPIFLNFNPPIPCGMGPVIHFFWIKTT